METWIKRTALALTVCTGLWAEGAEAERPHEGRDLVTTVNVELDGKTHALRTLRKVYKHLQKQQVAALLPLLAPDVRWTVEGATDAVPFAGVYEGRPGVARFLSILRENVELEEWSSRYVLAQDDAINVHLYVQGVARGTGKAFTMEVVHTWTFDARGRVRSFREFNDTFAMASAFGTELPEAYALVANDADYGIPESSFRDTIPVALAGYEALAAGNLQWYLDHTSDDLVWILAGPTDRVPIAGTFYGQAGMVDFLTRVYTTEAYIDFRVNSMVTDGSRLDAQFSETVYVFATGKAFTCEGLHSSNLDASGKMVSFRSYNDTYSVALGHSAD